MSLSPASGEISQASLPDANQPDQGEAVQSDPAAGQVTQHESGRSSPTSRPDDVQVPPSSASSGDAGDAGEPGPRETVSIRDGEPSATSTETNTTQTTGKAPVVVVVEESIGRQPRRHSPLRQSAPAWFSACVATGIYITTVCYAFGSTGLRYLSFTALNPGNTLLVLRTLSELTNASLVFLIGLSAERALWMLIAQDGGTRLSSSLALCPGSGPWGWIKLLYLNAGGARRLSGLKLVIVIIPPAMGIVLLSNVDVRMYFDHDASFPISAGIGDFNASWADIYASVAVTLMASDYSALLQTSAVSWSVPVIDSGRSECDVSNFFSNETCEWGYFLHGGSHWTLPTLPHRTQASRDERDCIVLGRESNAVGICLAQTAAAAANAVTAKFVVCPAESSSFNKARVDDDRARAYVRHATVHLSRANLSAIALSDFSTTPTPTPQPIISAADLLLLYNTTLGVRSSKHAFDEPRVRGRARSPTAAQAVFEPVQPARHAAVLFPADVHVAVQRRAFRPTAWLMVLPPDQPDLYVTASLSTNVLRLGRRRVERVAVYCCYGHAAAVLSVLPCSRSVVCLEAVTAVTAAAAARGRIPNTTAWSFVDFVAECDVGEGGMEDDEEEEDEDHTGGARRGG
ncbi:hypothetical protein CLCR_03352 [Cladophialophora carrionii]|uniref:Uncharacterized protein n=1 Tax=Cladophialophora carrionii TaxID=86049 RepID=A0A1C1CGX1_9EURO|nr:hypothetical protein CLCR_03352 [Cladophialophora carrionii]